MEPTTEFFNLYVETITKELGELNKTILLLKTQVAYQEKKTAELAEQNVLLQQQNGSLQRRLADTVADVPTTKSPKRKRTEEPVTEDAGQF